MQFGYCLNLNFLLNHDPRGEEIFAGVLAAGYDYVETQLTNLLSLPAAKYEGFKRRLAEAGVPCRAGMMIFPYGMPLVSDERDLRAITEHAGRVMPIAADLGCELLVFGHGGTRRVPEGMTREATRRRLIEVLRILDELTADLGIKLAIEPLCAQDTDFINSLPEALEVARACGANTGALFDLYHAAAEGQPPADIALAGDRLFHLHIANPNGRTVPADSDDNGCYRAFAGAVRQCGYNGRMSVEAGIPDGADAARAVAGALRIARQYFAEGSV